MGENTGFRQSAFKVSTRFIWARLFIGIVSTNKWKTILKSIVWQYVWWLYEVIIWCLNDKDDRSNTILLRQYYKIKASKKKEVTIQTVISLLTSVCTKEKCLNIFNVAVEFIALFLTVFLGLRCSILCTSILCSGLELVFYLCFAASCDYFAQYLNKGWLPIILKYSGVLQRTILLLIFVFCHMLSLCLPLILVQVKCTDGIFI